MAQIDKLGREQAIELAKRMRNKARNAELDSKRLTKRLIGVGSSAGAAYLLGGFMEGKEKEFAKIQEENAGKPDSEKDKTDPREMFGLDYELVVGLGLSGLGLAMQSGRLGKKTGGMLADVVEGAGSGCLAAAMYQKGKDAAAEAEDEEE